MKKVQILSSMMLVFLLVFSFAGHSLAAQEVKMNVAEDGRVQITLEFDDADDAKWAAEYIGKMKAKNILSGYPDDSFRPNQPVTRVEAIVTAVRLMGLEEDAKAKSLQTKLHFKDTKLLNEKYSWAKGYVIVALENGLFDASEDRIQPDKPASRVWVSSLLVRSLGLQSEALRQMTTVPDFKDASGIPAGAVGYVNVAVEEGLVSGYPDHTFKPNKNVTRAEMAAFLDRTDDGLQENSGAVKVRGTVTDIGFETDNMTKDLEKDASLTLTVESFNGESLTYSIAPALLVQYHGRFIRADQLLVNDVVTLVVQDKKVIEASLADKEESEATSGILEFKVKVELGDEQEYKLKYKNDDGKIKAEIEKKTEGDKEKSTGKEAVAAVEAFLDQLSVTPDMSKDEIVEAILTALQIEENQFKELEIEIKFSHGKKVEIEVENEDFDEESEEEEED